MLGAFNTFGEENTGKARMGGATRPSVFKLALRFKMKHRQANAVSGSELWSRRASHPGLPEQVTYFFSNGVSSPRHRI